jgi:tRNA-Thr(GGU) m(6)t(6)A37 methyltransferase TsaA
MEPDGDKMNRQIICSTNTPDDVRARLSQLYDRQLDPNTFQGSFGETLPKDIGGFGKYVYLDNPMGRVYLYVERLQGRDSQALEVQEAFSGADRLVDLLIDWLQTELGQNPNFEKLRVFCDKSLREDLKSLSLYSWLDDRASVKSEETFIRILLYLYERDYFTLDDILRMNSSIDEKEFVLSHLKRLLADKLEYQDDKKALAELEFLQDPNNLIASLNRFIASDIFRDRLTSHARKRTGDPDLVLDPCDVPETIDDVTEMFSEVFFIDIFGPSGDTVTVKLLWPGDPQEGTNGQWDEQNGQLVWSHKSRPVELPFLCYASFDQANETFQEAHFGEVVLHGDELFQYSFWYKGLSAEQRTEWDDFLVGLDGGEDVSSEVESFRFKSAATPSADSDGEAELLSDLPRGLIGKGLKTNEQGGQELDSRQDIKEQDQSFAVHPIGKVVKKDGKSFIVLDKQYQAGLKGLEKHAYVNVVYWFDKNDTPEKRAILEVHPRGDKSNPLTGVFATHSPFRPNLLAISKCDIIVIRENIIEVKDIDAFDGSPVLDLKGDFFRFHKPGTEQ